MILSVGESKPRKKKLFSSLTMWFEDVDHSHVFVSWKDDLGLRWVAEARGTGVRMLSNVEFKKDNILVNIYDYETDHVGIDSLIEYAWYNMGIYYGFKQIYGLFEMRILSTIYSALGINKKAKNRFVDGYGSLICNEFASGCLTAGAGIVIEEDIEQWGLKEMRYFNLNHGKIKPKVIIDKINGVA